VTSLFGVCVKSHWRTDLCDVTARSSCGQNCKPKFLVLPRYFGFARNVLRKNGSILVKFIEHNLKVYIVNMFVVAD